MRAAPPVQILLCRFGIWRIAVSGIATTACLASGLWLAQRSPAPSVAILTATGASVLIAACICWQLLRMQPTSLRWDGEAWHVGPPETLGNEPVAGDVEVAIDLGMWMLLRFAREGSISRRSVTWLPIQRWGLEAQWHALRCAVYSPRSPPGVAPKADL